MKCAVVMFTIAVSACAVGCVSPPPDGEPETAVSPAVDRAADRSVSPAVDGDVEMILSPGQPGSVGTYSVDPGCGPSHANLCARVSSTCGSCTGPNNAAWHWAGDAWNTCNACGCTPCPTIWPLCQSC